MLKQFTVVSATATTNNNHCVKLQHREEVIVNTAFGDAISSQQTTYYIFTTVAPPIGFKAPLDVSIFDIVNKEHTAQDGTVVSLKYLYPKKG